MSENIRYEKREIDLYNQNIESIPLIQNNSTILEFIVTANLVPFIPTEVVLNAVREDNTFVSQVDNILINQNSVVIALNPRIVDIPGTVRLEMQMPDADSIISTYVFHIHVSPTVLNGQSESPSASEIGKMLYLSTRAPEIDDATKNWILYNPETGQMEVSEYPSRGEKGDPGGDGGGTGQDGRTPELRAANGYIQWRYVGETSWNNLVALADLTGSKGDTGTDGINGIDGIDGKSVNLQIADGYIQWQRDGDSTWQNLIALDEIIDVTDIESEISNIANDISDITNDIATINGEITDMANDIDNNKYVIDYLDSNVDLLLGSMVDLETNMADTANDIVALDTRVTAIENTPSGNSADYANAITKTMEVARTHNITDMSPTYTRWRTLVLYGNPEQSGKNIFDYQAAFEIAQAIEPAGVSMVTKDGRYCMYFTSLVHSPNDPFPITFKSNTQYTINYDYYQETNATSGAGQGFQITYTDNSIAYALPSEGVYNTWATRTFTTAAGKTVREIHYMFANDIRTYLDVNTMQIEEGTIATSFEPYTPAGVVTDPAITIYDPATPTQSQTITLTGITLMSSDYINAADGIVTLTQGGVATDITSTANGQALLNLHGYSPNTVVTCDAISSATYNVDTQIAFDRLQAQLAMLINSINGG